MHLAKLVWSVSPMKQRIKVSPGRLRDHGVEVAVIAGWQRMGQNFFVKAYKSFVIEHRTDRRNQRLHLPVIEEVKSVVIERERILATFAENIVRRELAEIDGQAGKLAWSIESGTDKAGIARYPIRAHLTFEPVGGADFADHATIEVDDLCLILVGPRLLRSDGFAAK